MQKTIKTTSDWLTQVQKKLKKNGTFSAYDTLDTPIVFEWETITSPSPRLSEKIRHLTDILVETYTAGEMLFARKYPHAIPNEYFLKPLAPLFKSGTKNVDWDLVEKEIKNIFQKFFTTTDFAKFSTGNEFHIFVVAKDKKTDTPLGLIQFLITPEWAHGDVKAAFYGVIPAAQNRGLDKLLMSSIFKLIPATKRIFIHTRSTNEHAINAYKNWGFIEFSSPTKHWTNLEYKTEQSNSLQKIAKTYE